MNNIKKDPLTFAVLQWDKCGKELEGEVFEGTRLECEAFIAAKKEISCLCKDPNPPIFEIVLSSDEE